MSEQEWSRLREQWQALLREILDTLPLKQVAADLGISVSMLSHAASGRGTHAFHSSWIPYLIAKAPSQDALAFLAGLRGLVLADPPKLTPEEELRALKSAMHESLGEDVRKLIFAKAKAGR